MLCQAEITDYIIVSTPQVADYLTQGYRLYGNAFYHPEAEGDKLVQVLVKAQDTVLATDPLIPNFHLTPREMQCLTALMLHSSMKAIADHLQLSERTVEDYFMALRHKFQCEKTHELIPAAQRLGFIVNGQVHKYARLTDK